MKRRKDSMNSNACSFIRIVHGPLPTIFALKLLYTRYITHILLLNMLPCKVYVSVGSPTACRGAVVLVLREVIDILSYWMKHMFKNI